jgi:hypothetical protein
MDELTRDDGEQLAALESGHALVTFKVRAPETRLGGPDGCTVPRQSSEPAREWPPQGADGPE